MEKLGRVGSLNQSEHDTIRAIQELITNKDKYPSKDEFIGAITKSFPNVNVDVMFSLANDLQKGASIGDITNAYSGDISDKAIQKVFDGYSKYKQEQEENESKELTNKILGTAGAVVGGEAAAYGLGGLLKNLGKSIYGTEVGLGKGQGGLVTSEEPFADLLGTAKTRTTTKTALDVGNIFKQTGTTKGIGRTANQQANKIWKRVSPLFDKVTDNFSIDDVINKSIELLDNTNMNQFEKTQIKDEMGNVRNLLGKIISKKIPLNRMSAKDVQDIKSFVYTMNVPEKYYAGGTIRDSLQKAQAFFAAGARGLVNNAVSKANGIPIEKFDRDLIDYGNLIGLKETMGKKLEAAKSSNLGSKVYQLLGSIVQPISTIGGKTAYKTGKGLQNLTGIPLIKKLIDGINKTEPLIEQGGDVLKKVSPVINKVGKVPGLKAVPYVGAALTALDAASELVPGVNASETKGTAPIQQQVKQTQVPQYGKKQATISESNMTAKPIKLNRVLDTIPKDSTTSVGRSIVRATLVDDVIGAAERLVNQGNKQLNKLGVKLKNIFGKQQPEQTNTKIK